MPITSPMTSTRAEIASAEPSVFSSIIIFAAITFVRAITEPTERSMPRDSTTTLCAIAANASGMPEITSDWMSNEVKRGATLASMMSSTTRIATTPSVHAWRASVRRSLSPRGGRRVPAG